MRRSVGGLICCAGVCGRLQQCSCAGEPPQLGCVHWLGACRGGYLLERSPQPEPHLALCRPALPASPAAVAPALDSGPRHRLIRTGCMSHAIVPDAHNEAQVQMAANLCHLCA